MALRRFSKLYPAVFAGLFIGFLIIYQLAQYNKHDLVGTFKYAYNQGDGPIKKVPKDQVIFPKNFPVEKEKLQQYVEENFNMTDLTKSSMIKCQDNKIELPTTAGFTKHNITVFQSNKNIGLNLKQCSPRLESTSVVEIDKARNIGVSMTEILTNFIKEHETNPYYQELSPFFINELKLQLEYDVVHKFWYRLAGSSVWLEQYGVHFMISRILYSPSAARNRPIISLTYGQLFTKDWKELTNTKLVVPTNNLRSSSDEYEASEEQKFEVLKFPYFLPIPFWHDYDNVEHKYYGPEDPRVLLVKNSKGYTEPLIIFNAYHRKLSSFDDDEDDKIVMKPDFYRSMFMCWPWQFQKGKENTDGLANEDYDNRTYNKVVELKIKNIPRQKKQKNWTPFISENLRTINGYDKFINFVYRWADFEVLKCDLIHDTGSCSFTYRLNNELSTGSQVGPLRGGTELKNINDMIKTQTDLAIEKILPPGREVWLGFARAHIDKCGCGNNMYRPNLVVVVKDSILTKKVVDDEKSSKIYKDFYKVSHISSSISLNIPIIGWDLERPKDVCIGSNVLIPNGISSWNIQSIKENFDTGFFDAEDYLTLSLSISDVTVHTINIKGLLGQILKLNDKSLFLQAEKNTDESEASVKNLHIPDANIIDNPLKNNKVHLIGYNNDNLVCALQGSSEFCQEYGRENENVFEDDLQYDNGEEYADSNIAKYDEAMHLYKVNENLRRSAKLPKLPIRQSSPRKTH